MRWDRGEMEEKTPNPKTYSCFTFVVFLIQNTIKNPLKSKKTDGKL